MDKCARYTTLKKLYTVHIIKTQAIEFTVYAEDFEDASKQAHKVYDNGECSTYTDQIDATIRIHESTDDEANSLVMISPRKEN